MLCLHLAAPRSQIRPFSQLFRAWRNLLGVIHFCAGHSDFQLLERKEKFIRILWFPDCGRTKEEEKPSQKGEWGDREEKPQEGPQCWVSLLPTTPAAPFSRRPLSVRAVQTVRKFFLFLLKAWGFRLKQADLSKGTRGKLRAVGGSPLAAMLKVTTRFNPKQLI